MNKRLGLSILAIVCVFGLIGLIFYPRDHSLARLRQAGKIRIGYAVEAPYGILNQDGSVSGSEIEVAKYVVSQLKIPDIEWRLIEFDDLIPQLESGAVDVIAAGMFITPDRAKQVSFSEPTFHVTQGLLVASGNPHALHSYADVAIQPAVRIAVLSGAVEEGILLQSGVGPDQLIRVPDAMTGRIAVETGVVDGLALSSITIRWMALQDTLGLTELATPFTQPSDETSRYLGYGADAFRSQDIQLRNAWNEVLRQYIGTPAHLQVITPFGFTPTELPGAVTTEEILSNP